MAKTAKSFDYNHRVLGVTAVLVGLILFFASVWFFWSSTQWVGSGFYNHLTTLSFFVASVFLFSASVFVILAGFRMFKKEEVIETNGKYLIAFSVLMLAETILVFVLVFISSFMNDYYDFASSLAFSISALFFSIISFYVFILVVRKYELNLKKLYIAGLAVLIGLIVLTWLIPTSNFGYFQTQPSSIYFSNNPTVMFLNGTPVEGAEVDVYSNPYSNFSNVTFIGVYHTDLNGQIDVANLTKTINSTSNFIPGDFGLVVYAKIDGYEGNGYLSYGYTNAMGGGGGYASNIIYLIKNESYYPQDAYGLEFGIYIINSTVLYYGSLENTNNNGYNQLICLSQQQECIKINNCTVEGCGVNILK